MITYLVTTEQQYLPQMRTAMVDGTVPGWVPRDEVIDGSEDLHYDHHRTGGGKVQIDEMINSPFFENGCIVTTLCDADAICAAAWLQLQPEERTENKRKLWAIAHDCDYLWCPDEELAEWAAKAVAALKLSGSSTAELLGLPKDRKDWTAEQKQAYSSKCFELGTQWILAACRGWRKWPGESGEADQYWQKLEDDAAMLLEQCRCSVIDEIGVVDLRGIGRYVDPRAQQKALVQFDGEQSGIQISVSDHKNGGIQYTLGSIPSLAPDNLDYCKDPSVWYLLTVAEGAIRGIAHETVDHWWGNTNFESGVGFSCWGGRAVVGGSGWNTPSLLLPHGVVRIVNQFLENSADLRIPTSP